MQNLTPTNKGTYKFRTANPETLKAGESIEGWEIEIYYDKGGANMFSGANEARGIRAMISPVKFVRDDWQAEGRYSASITLGDSRGLRGLLLPLKAKSDKKLAAIAAQVDSVIPDAAKIVTDGGDSRRAFDLIQQAVR